MPLARFRCFSRTQRSLRRTHPPSWSRSRLRPGVPVIRDPSQQERVEFSHHPLEAHASIATGDLADAVFGPIQALRGDRQRAVGEQAVSQELAFPYGGRRALLTVDSQSQSPFEEPSHRCEHAFPSGLRLHVDVAVVGVPAELVPSVLQFLVQIIQQQIGKQGGQRTALRRPFVALDAHAVLQESRLQEAADNPQQAFIADAPGDPRHEDVVVHPVEELFQVQIDNDRAALGHVSTRLAQRLVGAAA